MKFVIRAGGVGTRLWPLSRKNRPKQFHALTGERTMLQEAVNRLHSMAKIDDLYVSTGVELLHSLREQLPGLPPENAIVEPALRNTGPAVGLECALLEARFPGCTIASLGSDHHIGKPEEFCRLLKVAEDALEDRAETLFVLGVKPNACRHWLWIYTKERCDCKDRQRANLCRRVIYRKTRCESCKNISGERSLSVE